MTGAREAIDRLIEERMSDTQKRIHTLIEREAQEQYERVIDEFMRLRDHCESPIEEMLLAGLYSKQSDGLARLVFVGPGPIDTRYMEEETVYVFQQVNIGRYRADIAIYDGSVPPEIAPPRIILVECDGHDFHERTKEQARHDKRRDRYFQSLGYKVLHFTGSEIWADPEACADEIIGQLGVCHGSPWSSHYQPEGDET